MKKILIFGGSFNPIHFGHINLVLKFKSHIKPHLSYIVPTKIPPHKPASNIESSIDRFNMCRLAFENNDDIIISDFEIKSKNKSFTIYTVRHFLKIHPNCKPFLIVGSDMLFSIEHWYEFRQILNNVTLCSAARFRHEYNRMMEFSKHLEENYNASVLIEKINSVEISSTQIRENINDTDFLSKTIPTKIAEYIRQHNLYRSGKSEKKVIL